MCTAEAARKNVAQEQTPTCSPAPPPLWRRLPLGPLLEARWWGRGKRGPLQQGVPARKGNDEGRATGGRRSATGEKKHSQGRKQAAVIQGTHVGTGQKRQRLTRRAPSKDPDAPAPGHRLREHAFGPHPARAHVAHNGRYSRTNSFLGSSSVGWLVSAAGHRRCSTCNAPYMQPCNVFWYLLRSERTTTPSSRGALGRLWRERVLWHVAATLPPPAKGLRAGSGSAGCAGSAATVKQ